MCVGGGEGMGSVRRFLYLESEHLFTLNILGLVPLDARNRSMLIIFAEIS